MARPDFYNENEYRAYPFVAHWNVQAYVGEETLNTAPTMLVVDFGAIMGLDAEFVDGEHRVYLYALSRAGDTFTYDFRTDAPGVSVPLRFTRELTDDPYTAEHAEADLEGSASSAAGYCGDLPVWEGFLITGPMTAAAELLPADGTVVFGPDQQIEPSRIQNLARAFLRSVSLANYERSVATLGEDCDDPAIPNPRRTFVVRQCMDGDLRLQEGFNCDIRQEDGNNTIVISASVGAGAGEPCEEVPTHPDEEKPAGSQFYSGGPSCTEIVKAINGVGGPVVRLFAGAGVSVEPHETDLNTLVVDVHLRDFAVCLGNG